MDPHTEPTNAEPTTAERSAAAEYRGPVFDLRERTTPDETDSEPSGQDPS